MNFHLSMISSVPSALCQHVCKTVVDSCDGSVQDTSFNSKGTVAFGVEHSRPQCLQNWHFYNKPLKLGRNFSYIPE